MTSHAPRRLDGIDMVCASLREHAMARSRFYQRFHRDLESAPLAELPVLSKGTLMENFDELVVDPRVKLADVLAYLEVPLRSRRVDDAHRVLRARRSGRASPPD